MQNEANRSRRSRGKPEPISALGPVGEETRAIVGRYVSQGDLSAWVRRADRESVFVNYETIEREPVYQLTLRRGRQNEVRIPHAFRQVADASLKKGQWIAVVIQDGELAKVVVEGDKYPLVDTSLDFTEDPTSPIGARFGSYSPARPWSLGLAVEFLLDEKPKPTGQGCLLCGNEQGVVEDFTLRCPNCTNDLRYSAELLLADLVEPEIAFAVLSRLETDWLLNQIPKRVEVPA